MQYRDNNRKKHSLKWVYLILIVAFFVWVMSDELGSNNQVEQVIHIELPK